MSHLTVAGQLSSKQVDQVITWARQAGQIALHHFKRATPQRKSDQSFLTEADLAIDKFLVERLRAAHPQAGIISEEGTHSSANDHSTEWWWVVDPIDGTTAYVQGLPGWGISIGLLYRGHPCFGLFYMPLLKDLTYTAGLEEVYNNERSLRRAVRQNWGQKGFLAVNARAHHQFQIDFPRTRALGSVSASLAYFARGSAVAAFVPKARLWDLVAGATILTRAGGALRYLSGQPVDYLPLLDGRLIPEPIIAGCPPVLAQLQHSIRPHAQVAIN